MTGTKLEPCKSFMLVPPFGVEDPMLLARLQYDLIETFPDFLIAVMTEGAPNRYADFFLVPVILDYGDGNVEEEQEGTISSKMLEDLATLLAPYIGSDNFVPLIVKMGGPLQTVDDVEPELPPTRH